MKKFRSLFLMAVSVFAACGPVQEQKPEGDESLVDGKLALVADKTVVCADGTDKVTFTVTVTDDKGNVTDVTEDSEVYSAQTEQLIEGGVFTATQTGEYSFYAVYGLSISKAVDVMALAVVPQIPADPQEESMEFRHRMLLVQHTGATCPNCPLMMTSLKRLSEDVKYNQSYNLVASHSYYDGLNDDAYSEAAKTLSATFCSGAYPELSFNLTNISVGHDYDDICDRVTEHMKESSTVGIAAAVEAVDGEVIANVEVKFAKEGTFRIGAWLLEDNIFARQSGASESWQHYHNNALRAMAGERQTENIYGLSAGTVSAGQKLEKIFCFEVAEGWVAENCKVLVFVTESDDAGNFDIVNCAVCDAGDAIMYDYK